MVRKSPTQSATLYKLGTKKEGNDGNQWIVIETSNGVKRWNLFRKSSKKTSKQTKNSSKKTSKQTKNSSKKTSKKILIAQDRKSKNNSLKITKLGLLFLDFIENENLFPKSSKDVAKLDKDLSIIWKTLKKNGLIGTIGKTKLTEETYYIDGKDWVYLANIALEMGNRKKYYYEPSVITKEGKELLIKKLKSMKFFE